MKKGQFFELDIMLAALIIIGSTVFLLNQPQQSNDTKIEDLKKDVDDTARALQELKMNEIFDEDDLDSFESDIFNANNTVSKQILLYHTVGENDKINTIMNETLTRLNLSQRGYEVQIDDVTVANETEGENTTRFRRDILVSGVEEGKTLEGITGTMRLSRVTESSFKRESFGGFYGQGDMNISLNLSGIETVTKLRVEGFFNNEADLMINGQKCSDIEEGFTVIEPDCISDLQDENIIGIDFEGNNITRNYVSGGGITAYHDEVKEYEALTDYDIREENIADVKGLFNIYDSFYNSENTNNVRIEAEADINLLDNNQNHTLVVTAGDKILERRKNINGTVQIDENIDLSSSGIEDGTNPFRIGFENITRKLEQNEELDVVVVTDLSGSMNFNFTDSWSSGVERGCDDEDLFDLDTKRLSVAKCSLYNVTKKLGNNPGMRVGLVDFSANADTSIGLTDDVEALNNTIEGYDASGSTCVSCGINESMELLKQQGEEDREQIMVVMTDGLANQCLPGTSCDPFEQARDEAEKAHNGRGIGLYTIAFVVEGSGADLMQDIAAIDDPDNFFEGSNPERTLDIYDEIADEIIEQAGFRSQAIEGNFSERSTKLKDARVTTNTTIPDQEGIRVSIEQPLDSCDDTFSFPTSLSPINSYVTTYSRKYWTHNVELNGKTQYDINEFNKSPKIIGDPHRVWLSTKDIQSKNTINITTGDDTLDTTYCSPNNKVITEAVIPRQTITSKVYATAEPCEWTIEMRDKEKEVTIPDTSASQTCSYTTDEITYDENDFYQDMTYQTLRQLDTNNNGTIPFDLQEESLEFDFQTVNDLPFLWGPNEIGVILSD